jgi:hypothetical protein
VSISERLRHVRVKLERAEQHLDALEKLVGAFIEDQPFRISQSLDPETGDTVATVIVRREPPPIFGAIVGDYVHNLRAALDYVAWQLVDCNTGAPGAHTYYPICNTQREFDYKSVRMLRGASPLAIAAVSVLQPFRSSDPHSHPLALVHRLDVEDKHRLLHVVGGVYSGPIEIETEEKEDIVVQRIDDPSPTGFLRHGAVLMRAPASVGDVRIRVRFGVALNTYRHPLMPTLMQVYAAIEQAVTDAAKYIS